MALETQTQQVNPLVPAEHVRVVPDEFDPKQFGLQVAPNTIAARGVEEALRAARGDLINDQGAVPMDAKFATLKVRELHGNTQRAQRQSAEQGRQVRPEAVHFDAGETAIIMHGLERAIADRSQGDQYTTEMTGTHSAITGQANELGLPMPDTPQSVPAQQKQ
jgi:hypothetical protein